MPAGVIFLLIGAGEEKGYRFATKNLAYTFAKPAPGDQVVFKQYSSGFDGTELHAELQAQGITALITCRIWSEHCVTNTSVDALALGLDVYLAADAHGTCSQERDDAESTIATQNAQLETKHAKVVDVAGLGRIVSAP